MIVQITGDRNWKDRDYIFNILDDFMALYKVERVRCGCAKGADRIVGWPCPVRLDPRAPEPPVGWAAARNVPVDHFPADWDRYGKPAGPIRNIQMLENKDEDQNIHYPDVCLAFHPTLNTSKGTAHMVKEARRAGVTTWIFPNTEVPMDFDFKRSLIFPLPHENVVQAGNAPNAEDAKLR
jgi:hypothetical protein